MITWLISQQLISSLAEPGSFFSSSPRHQERVSGRIIILTIYWRGVTSAGIDSTGRRVHAGSLIGTFASIFLLLYCIGKITKWWSTDFHPSSWLASRVVGFLSFYWPESDHVTATSAADWWQILWRILLLARWWSCDYSVNSWLVDTVQILLLVGMVVWNEHFNLFIMLIRCGWDPP